jgi:gluconokinase
MGVSGAGKSVVGAGLASRLGWAFVDADHLHPTSNVEKMASGIPLTDDDRWPWLDVVGATLAQHGDGVVMACSALRRAYRDRIRVAAPATFFVELDGTPELLLSRISGRVGHFMPPSLLTSQLATLESLGTDEAGARVSIDGTPEEVVTRAAAAVLDAESR